MSHRGLAKRDIALLGRKRTRAERDYDLSYYQIDKERLMKQPVETWPPEMLVSVPKCDMKIIPDYIALMSIKGVKVIEDQEKWLNMKMKSEVEHGDHKHLSPIS